MCNLIQKQSVNGNRQFCGTVYPTHSEALDAAKEMLTNAAVISVLIVKQETEFKLWYAQEAVARIKKSYNVK